MNWSAHHDTCLVKGVVVIDSKPIFGCEVKVVETRLIQQTNSQGEFELIVDSNLRKISLLFYYPKKELTGTTRVNNIELNSDVVRIDTIPVFFNQKISPLEYHKLSDESKNEYKEIRHWTELIGYMSKYKVDTTELRSSLWDKKRISYEYQESHNTIVIDNSQLTR